MKIAISGSTGFIGKQLTDYLLRSGNEVIPISRNDFANNNNQLTKIVNSVDVILNLAGSSVLCRWNRRNRQRILSSRIDTTRLLVKAVRENSSGHIPGLFINASAIGIYQDSEIHDEWSTKLNGDFLAFVCKAWENEIVPLKELNIRTCIVRTGIVLGPTGGSFAKMLPFFKAGLGGRIGSGKQLFSFIHIVDFCRAVQHLIEYPKSEGIYNLVNPETTTNEIFTKEFARILHRPAFFAVPQFALKLIFGEAAMLLTNGAGAKPVRLLNEGFQFKFPDISSSIAELVLNN